MTTAYSPESVTFPPFSLSRLLQTVFAPAKGSKICVLIDLEDPREIKDFAFLRNSDLTVQRHAYEVFYKGLQESVNAELALEGGEMFAYKVTGGSNLDLPDEAFDQQGRQVSLERDVYPNYDLILCISTYSATAPLTASAKKQGFRGATLHGLNETIINSGLAVNYEEVSRAAEKLRQGMTRADWAEIDFHVGGNTHTLKLLLDGQEAQKSHGLCRNGPDVANLPAGEIYYVPTGAEGEFPRQYEDGTLGLMKVSNGRIQQAELLHGAAETVETHNRKLASDPVTGEIGELGFGTQVLPPSGQDIQDEKILGTVHVATGRSDHLGGHLTPDLFAEASHATHDDILFSPTKTPGINVSQVRMHRDGKSEILIEDFTPARYMLSLLGE